MHFYEIWKTNVNRAVFWNNKNTLYKILNDKLENVNVLHSGDKFIAYILYKQLFLFEEGYGTTGYLKVDKKWLNLFLHYHPDVTFDQLHSQLMCV